MVFLSAVGLTAGSGIAATAIVMFGDTARNDGQRAVAVRLAHIAVTGATVLMALISSDAG